MKITITGVPGAGKSQISRMLATHYNLRHYSVGDLMREMAQERGITIDEFDKTIDAATDREVDERTRALGAREDNIVFDGRLAFHFIPDAIKIFLKVSLEQGAKRIFKHQRPTEEPANSIEELAERNRTRWEVTKKRYVERYGVDIDDLSGFDIVIDTTELTIDQAMAQVCADIDKFRAGQ